MNIDLLIAQLLGTFALANDSQINAFVDDTADKVLSAVKDSGTQIDDTAARVLSEKLERFAARVRNGLPV